MKHITRLLVAALVAAGLQLMACHQQHAAHKAEHPAEVKKIEGSDLSTVILTEHAMQRLDVKTDQVREQGGKAVVPYSSLIYDPKGQTWVYTSPAPRTFVRHKIDIDRINGDAVLLNDGPPAGTVIATVAVAEIYGTEMKVGH
jgi:vacuolar-type H+-ATPase subunit F/Vma7